ncbi:phosphatase phospho-type [Syncephalis fuscata]|nr:phosphatase phospho-type [Syncephalis fuscata]
MRTLVALDFDWTVIDADSDRSIFELLPPHILADFRANYFSSMQWTDLMDRIYTELHQSGKTRDQIEQVFRRLPLHPAMKAALQLAHQSGETELMIISDANTTAIWEFITNESQWTSDGRLSLQRYVSAHESHGCERTVQRRRPKSSDPTEDDTQPFCTINICKGKVMQRLRGNYDRVIYLGDGQNDFCPGCELRSQDIYMPRRNRALHRILSGPDAVSIQANIVYWSEASDVLNTFQSLFEATLSISATSIAEEQLSMVVPEKAKIAAR